MGDGIFGGLFDFNRDNHMSGLERAAEFATIAMILDDARGDSRSSHDDDYFTYVRTTSDDDGDPWDDDDWPSSGYGSSSDLSSYVDDGLDDYCSGRFGSLFGFDGDGFDGDSDDDGLIPGFDYTMATGRDYSDVDDSGLLPLTLTVSVVNTVEEARKAVPREGYPNVRTWNAACELKARMEDTPDCSDHLKLERERAEFVLSDPGITAARYFAIEKGFLYAQAAKERFELPIAVPDEDEEPKTRVEDLIKAIAWKDVGLAFDAWAWLVGEFMPYLRYEYSSRPEDELTACVLDEVAGVSGEALDEAVRRFASDGDLRSAVFGVPSTTAWETSTLLARALETGRSDAAAAILADVLANPRLDGRDVASMCGRALARCQNHRELETVLAFESSLMPLLRSSMHVAVQADLPEWERDIAQYVCRVEQTCPQYAYERRNAWRKNVPDGSAYGLDPVNFLTESSYLASLNQLKYGWRKRYAHMEEYGLNVGDFETKEEFVEALSRKRGEVLERELAKLRASGEASGRAATDSGAKPETMTEPKDGTEAGGAVFADDETVYEFAGVLLGEGRRPYSYLVGDLQVSLGDEVAVPVGSEGEEAVGEVVSIVRCTRSGAPYPPEKCKRILRLVQPS